MIFRMVHLVGFGDVGDVGDVVHERPLTGLSIIRRTARPEIDGGAPRSAERSM
jgi:hypothetical protein